MKKTRAKELMTKNIATISPTATLREAAEKMRDVECGVLPVGTESKLEGILTDRDIVIRAAAEGKDLSQERVGEYMTPDVCTCEEQDTLETVADEMRKHKVSRIIVQDSTGRATGILTLGRILREDENAEEITAVVERVSGEQKAA